MLRAPSLRKAEEEWRKVEKQRMSSILNVPQKGDFTVQELPGTETVIPMLSLFSFSWEQNLSVLKTWFG